MLLEFSQLHLGFQWKLAGWLHVSFSELRTPILTLITLQKETSCAQTAKKQQR